jgi:hypothetical protein
MMSIPTPVMDIKAKRLMLKAMLVAARVMVPRRPIKRRNTELIEIYYMIYIFLLPVIVLLNKGVFSFEGIIKTTHFEVSE